MRLSVFVLAAAACGGGTSSPSASDLKPSPATAAAPAPPASDLAAKVDAIVVPALREEKAPGLSVAVARGGQLLVAKGYGLADVEHQTPASADTVYRIGSITKQFTAVAILQLAEQGKLKLGDDIRAYVPELPARDTPITLEHLLGQTSGLFSFTSVPNWIDVGAKPMTRKQVLALFAEKPLAFAPGTRWEYSNSNYYLLGMVIEAVTKQSYADVIRDRVFKPAGMTSSAYCTDTLPQMAQGYSLPPTGAVPSKPLDLAHPFAAGALCSTARDLVAWQRALDSGKLLHADSLAKMRTAGVLPDRTSTHYGYGVFVGDLEGHPRIGHGGGINGFTSMLSRYPADDLTIVVLANAETSLPDKLEQKIARAVLGLAEVVVKRQPLTAAERASYAGTYLVQGFGSAGLPVRIYEQAEALHIQAPGQPAATLLSQGNHAFVLEEDPDVHIEFHAAGAQVTGFTIHQSGMTIEATR
jgi:D-alanyl-D-alanine carboxypeptidase